MELKKYPSFNVKIRSTLARKSFRLARLNDRKKYKMIDFLADNEDFYDYLLSYFDEGSKIALCGTSKKHRKLIRESLLESPIFYKFNIDFFIDNITNEKMTDVYLQNKKLFSSLLNIDMLKLYCHCSTLVSRFLFYPDLHSSSCPDCAICTLCKKFGTSICISRIYLLDNIKTLYDYNKNHEALVDLAPTFGMGHAIWLGRLGSMDGRIRSDLGAKRIGLNAKETNKNKKRVTVKEKIKEISIDNKNKVKQLLASCHSRESVNDLDKIKLNKHSCGKQSKHHHKQYCQRSR